MTKRIITIFMALTMVIGTVITTGITASAATSSSGTQTRKITVITKANYFIPGSESITLSQSKGVCKSNIRNVFTGKYTSNQYGTWDIEVRATDGSHTIKKTLTGSSIKIKLKPNKTYIITVSWNTRAELFKELEKGNYISFPTWRVKSTWKVSNYY